MDARTGVHVGRNGRLYVFTDAGAPRGRLAVADPAHPEPACWRDLITQDRTAILNDYAILDGAELRRPVLVVSWTRHAISEITVHDLATGGGQARWPCPARAARAVPPGWGPPGA